MIFGWKSVIVEVIGVLRGMVFRQMKVEIRFLGKGFRTERAHERFLAGVESSMIHQSRLLRKRLLTIRTLVRTLSSVSS